MNYSQKILWVIWATPGLVLFILSLFVKSDKWSQRMENFALTHLWIGSNNILGADAWDNVIFLLEDLKKNVKDK